jgi:hypothetical protein
LARFANRSSHSAKTARSAGISALSASPRNASRKATARDGRSEGGGGGVHQLGGTVDAHPKLAMIADSRDQPPQDVKCLPGQRRHLAGAGLDVRGTTISGNQK